MTLNKDKWCAMPAASMVYSQMRDSITMPAASKVYSGMCDDVLCDPCGVVGIICLYFSTNLVSLRDIYVVRCQWHQRFIAVCVMVFCSPPAGS
jgi:hypothetical protein